MHVPRRDVEIRSPRAARVCRGRPILYDHAVDLNTARHVLRLDPLAPLTAEAVETAYGREVWERHPSRYADGAGREAATAWHATLVEARATLLQSMAVTDATASAVSERAASSAVVPLEPMTSAIAIATHVPMPSATTSARERVVAPKRRRRAGHVIAVIAASLGVLALVVAVGVGAAMVAPQLERLASALDEPLQTDAPADVESYSADEMRFTFPAAMETYADGRYTKFCPFDFEDGCWETALITETSCAALEIDLQYANDAGAWTGEHMETIEKADVTGGEITPVVFGHDEYDFGWVHDVRCADATAASPQITEPIESSAATKAIATPLQRGEAANFTFEETGFWFVAALEVYEDDGLGECPAELERGCWHAAIIPEAKCERLEIQYSFSNGQQSEQKNRTSRTDVVAGEPVDVVFGDDHYDFGWISHVVCSS